MIPVEVESLLVALIFYGGLTAFYKDNPIYTVIEAVVIGAVIANELAIAIQRIHTGMLTPLITQGNLAVLGIILLGLMYFFIFSRRYSYIYRLIAVVTIASNFGLIQSFQLHTWFATNMMWASMVEDISSVILIVGVVTTTLYFTFSRQLEKPLGPVRTIGKLFLFAFFGISVGTMWWRYTNYAIGVALNAFPPPGIYVTLLVGLYILLDATGVIDRIRGRAAVEAVV